METSFHHLLLFVVLSLVFSSSLARPPNNGSQTSTSYGFDMLIKSLNLHPDRPANIHNSTDSQAPGTIVERRMVFPNIDATTEDLGHHSGFYQLSTHRDAKMFYFFFESRGSKEDPVVIWLTGGPGCGSEIALFLENGPVSLAGDLTLVPNEYGWDSVSNIIFIDQPVMTGFSYVSDEKEIPKDQRDVSNDLYDFLQEFFKQHPEYSTNPFYITGESYAGHYIPALAERINNANKAKAGIHINLKGFAIGNGITNPKLQFLTLRDYALMMKIITQSDYDDIQNLIPGCLDGIKSCEKDGTSCADAAVACQKILGFIIDAASDGRRVHINHYDIRKKCVGEMCYDLSRIERYLRQKSVRDALGVGDAYFVSCSSTVYDSMINDIVVNYVPYIPRLLHDGIKMLIYAGEYDLICNWLGNLEWIEDMHWLGASDFGEAPNIKYSVNGVEAGEVRTSPNVDFLKVYNAGHMVPMDQPAVALQMLKDWMHDSFPQRRKLNDSFSILK